MHEVSPEGHWISVQCPYCFEILEILVDADTEGDLVQDCEVCCHPWQIKVRRTRTGAPEVEIEAL